MFVSETKTYNFATYARRYGNGGWVHKVDVKYDKENVAISESFPGLEMLALKILQFAVNMSVAFIFEVSSNETW